MLEQNAELSYDLVSAGVNLKLMANAAKLTSPSYRVFASEEEALQAYPHLSVEQEHIPSGVVNGSRDNEGALIDSSVTVVDKESIPPFLLSTFKDSSYTTVITNKPISFFRKFGGDKNQAKADGSFVTTIRNASRQETAVYPKWSTSQFEAEIEVPKGVKINMGFVAEQPVGRDAPKYRGGADQILLPKGYPREWIKSVIDRKTGITYSLEEFQRSFPDQFGR